MNCLPDDAVLNLPETPTRAFLAGLLDGEGPDQHLFDAADARLRRDIGPWVYLRGLVEISNRCRKNCFYCGLRRDSASVDRYTIPPEEILEALEGGYRLGLRSFLLQSGEMLGKDHIETVARILRECSSVIPGSRMVLSLGELPPETYDMLREAGGDRYLLRIETSSPLLYRRYHPDDGVHSYRERLKALEYLRSSGWQTGTGVLTGLPEQSTEDLADDLLFMKGMDIDMIGMGPYIESPGTPMQDLFEGIPAPSVRTLRTLRMIALARLMIPGINIAATTALQTISPDGLERGLMAGANVVMPNLTPSRYRDNYDLYSGKTEVPDSPETMIEALRRRCGVIGRKIIMEDPGDPLHFLRRMEKGVDR